MKSWGHSRSLFGNRIFFCAALDRLFPSPQIRLGRGLRFQSGSCFSYVAWVTYWVIKNIPHHDDVIKWKHSPRNWPHKGQWRGALMFSLICVWINDWVNNREAGDLRRYRAHFDVTVLFSKQVWENDDDRTLMKAANDAEFAESKQGADDGRCCSVGTQTEWPSHGISVATQTENSYISPAAETLGTTTAGSAVQHNESDYQADIAACHKVSTYRKVFNIRPTKSQNLNNSCLVLQLSLPNLLKPCIKLRMKM